MSERQEALLPLLRKHGPAKTIDLARANKIKRDKVWHALKPLTRYGMVDFSEGQWKAL